MGTGMDTLPAAYAKVMIYDYLVSRTVVTIFYGAHGDTGMAVNAFFFINPDDGL
jgi:hypothetical protein